MLFHFNLTDGDDSIRDPEGIYLPGVESALTTAMEAFEELRQEGCSASHEWQGWRLEITDPSGWIVKSIPL